MKIKHRINKYRNFDYANYIILRHDINLYIYTAFCLQDKSIVKALFNYSNRYKYIIPSNLNISLDLDKYHYYYYLKLILNYPGQLYFNYTYDESYKVCAYNIKGNSIY